MILDHYLTCIIERTESSISVYLVLTLLTLDIYLPHTLCWRYTRITVLRGQFVQNLRERCNRCGSYWVLSNRIPIHSTEVYELAREVFVTLSAFVISERYPDRKSLNPFKVIIEAR